MSNATANNTPAQPVATSSLRPRFYSPNDVCILLGFDRPLDRSTLWRWVRRKLIDPPTQIGPNRTGWPVEYIEQWIRDRPCGLAEQPAALREAMPRTQELRQRWTSRAQEPNDVMVEAHA